ncbi:MAG: hypothetical protein IJ745_04035 [Bacteroidales bacterium]|nr:hypothetical protein [Bacteroidales bacterium]
MKKSLLLLALLLPATLCPASCGTCGRKTPTKTIQPDSAVYAMLGRTMTDVLFHPTSVKCYTLIGKERADSTDYQVEPHWVRDSLLGSLTTELAGVLQFALIANPANYHFDSIRVKAPYMPLLVFEFQKKKNVVHVLLSPLDYTWTIMYDDKRQIHFNYHDRELIERFCALFLQTEK